ALARGLARIREQLAGLPELALPTDRPRSKAPRRRGARVPISLPAALVAELRRAGDLPALLLAALQAVLQRYARQDDLAVGVRAAGCSPAAPGAIGPLENLLVVRADLGGDPPFAQLAARARAAWSAALAHREVPFERVADALHPERNPG